MKPYVFIYIAAGLLLSACKQRVPAEKIINQKASLPASFGLDKMGVITSFINKRQHSMSTLYGNTVAVQRARSGAAIQPDEKLVLVTWKQKADEGWFGANIPDEVQSLEQVTTGAKPDEAGYQRYEGTPLSLSRDTIAESRRINAIFGMQASVMP
jgi:hypothetical protein